MNRHFGRATLCGLAMLAFSTCVVAEENANSSLSSVRRPVEDFILPPAVFRVRMSPDGKHLGFLGAVENRTALVLLDLQTMKSSISQLGWVTSRDLAYSFSREINDFIWAGNERVVVSSVVPAEAVNSGLAGMNLDSSGWVGLTGALRANSKPKGPKGERLVSDLMQEESDSPSRLLLLEAVSVKGPARYDVVEMNTLTGEYQTVAKNPGDVNSWVANERGEVLVAVVNTGGKVLLRYRTTTGEAWREWGALPVGETWRLLGLRGGKLYLNRPAEDGRWSVYAYPIDGGPRGERLIWHHPEYDFLPQTSPNDEGDRLMFSRDTGELLGLHYRTAGPQTEWFSPRLAQVQAQLEKLKPGLSHTLLEVDKEGKKVLILSRSARQAGLYSLLDLETMKMAQIASVRGWFEPEAMAEVFPIQFSARDGLLLSGYFTPPLGRPAKRLPTVVLVRNGPAGRDQWEFNTQVQFLASRGYAVLQINYRGSRGFGDKFAVAGRDSLGADMAEDINDGVRWAIKQGLVDEKRIALMGLGFGATCAFEAAAQQSSLYRGIVAVAPVADWEDLHDRRDHPDYRRAYPYWVSALPALADAATRARYNSVAPALAAARLKCPVFLIHGKIDPIVPYQQGMLLKSALRRHDVPLELFTPDFLSHAYPLGELGVSFLTKLEAFLAKNLGSP